MSQIVIKLDNDRTNTFNFTELSAITITPRYVEMRFDSSNDLNSDLYEGVCKYTYKNKITGVEIMYDE